MCQKAFVFFLIKQRRVGLFCFLWHIINNITKNRRDIVKPISALQHITSGSSFTVWKISRGYSQVIRKVNLETVHDLYSYLGVSHLKP